MVLDTGKIFLLSFLFQWGIRSLLRTGTILQILGKCFYLGQKKESTIVTNRISASLLFQTNATIVQCPTESIKNDCLSVPHYGAEEVCMEWDPWGYICAIALNFPILSNCRLLFYSSKNANQIESPISSFPYGKVTEWFLRIIFSKRRIRTTTEPQLLFGTLPRLPGLCKDFWYLLSTDKVIHDLFSMKFWRSPLRFQPMRWSHLFDGKRWLSFLFSRASSRTSQYGQCKVL